MRPFATQLSQALGRKRKYEMKHRVQFISLEEDDKDLIVSFAVDDEDMVVSFAVDDEDMGVKSIVLLRTLFYEELLDEDERGVNVSLEGDYFEREDFNMLENITINNKEIEIKATFREYKLDISKISKSDITEMITLLKKQNYDNRFSIHSASYLSGRT